MTTSSKRFPATADTPMARPIPLTLAPTHDVRPTACGLYITRMSRNFPFADLLASRAETMSIGTSYRCAIRLPHRMAEHRHALLEYKNGVMYLIDNTKDHNTFVDGWQLVRSVAIRVGMIIKVGEVRMIGTNKHGRFLMTVSELCRKASELGGSHRAAAQQVGRSHNFVRKQFTPRSKRYKK